MPRTADSGMWLHKQLDSQLDCRRCKNPYTTQWMALLVFVQPRHLAGVGTMDRWVAHQHMGPLH